MSGDIDPSEFDDASGSLQRCVQQRELVKARGKHSGYRILPTIAEVGDQYMINAPKCSEIFALSAMPLHAGRKDVRAKVKTSILTSMNQQGHAASADAVAIVSGSGSNFAAVSARFGRKLDGK